MYQRKPQVYVELPMETSLIDITNAAQILGMEVRSLHSFKRKAHANDHDQGPPTHRAIYLDVLAENSRVIPGT